MAMSKATIRNFGERIRHARREAGLSQSELARGISHIAKSKTTKSLVSQWETGKVQNPQNATLLAIAAVTGFSQQWLVTGKGAEKGLLPPLMVAQENPAYASGLDRDVLRRAILIACSEQTDPAAIAYAAIEVFETLADEPDAPDGALKRIARLANVKS